MTEPREPEAPQPEDATVMPSTPAGHWPPPAATPSFPPPPAAGFPAAPPPMPPAPGMPVAPPQPPPTYADPPAAPVARVEVSETADAEADEISEGAPVYETGPAAEPLVDADPVVVEMPADAEFVELATEGSVDAPYPVETEPLSEPAEVALADVVADEPPVEAAPSLPGPSLPSVPAWLAPPTPPAPEPVADQPVAADVEAQASADEAVDQAQDAAPGLAVATPGLLLPPPPPAQTFQPAAVLTPTPPASEGSDTQAAAKDEATQVAPTWGTPVTEPAVAASSDIFRPYPGSAAAATDAQAVTEEERRLAAERAARRDARAAALTATAVAPVTPAPSPEPAPVAAAPAREVRRSADGFWASLGLFLVRLVMAAIFGVHGVQMLVQTAATQQLFGGTILPMPGTLGLVTAVASVLISISMLLGLATRYSAIGATLIAVGSLGLVFWGSWGVFEPGKFGFLGEGVLLVAVVGLLLTFIGGGGWSLDHSLRAARHRDKATRAID